jgi:hypothetical protein
MKWAVIASTDSDAETQTGEMATMLKTGFVMDVKKCTAIKSLHGARLTDANYAQDNRKKNTNNKRKIKMEKRLKLNKLARAANALRTATQALQQIMEDKSDSAYLCEDARYYLKEINDLLSCDHEQGGLDALIRKVGATLERK